MTAQENLCVDFLQKYVRKYSAFPSVDTFKEDFKHYYTESYKGDAVEHLFGKYIQEKREDHIMRVLDNVHLERGAGKPISVGAVIDDLKHAPDDGNAGIKSLSEQFDEDDDMFEGKSPNSFTLGFSEKQDDEIGSLEPGIMFGLVANEKTGKSFVASILACKSFLANEKVLLLTYEMSEKQLRKRVWACLGAYNTKMYRSAIGSPAQAKLKGILKPKVKKIVQHQEAFGGKLILKSGVDMNGLRNILLKEQQETGRPFDKIFVDGIYLIPSDTTAENHVNITRNLNSLRSLCNGDEILDPVAVFFTSQFNKDAKNKHVGAYNTSDIGKSVAISQVPDVILGMVTDDEFGAGACRVFIMAARDGDSGSHANAQITIDFDETMIRTYPDVKAISITEPLMRIPVITSVPATPVVDDEEEAYDDDEVVTIKTTTSSSLVGIDDEEPFLFPNNDIEIYKRLGMVKKIAWDELVKEHKGTNDELMAKWDVMTGGA